MQDLLDRKAGLTDARRALLEKRLRGESRGARPREAITRCAGDGPVFPLSFAQERMWFLAQMDPGSPMYQVPVAISIRADVDVDVLERAVAEVVRRHEALRTVYRMVGGELKSVVLPPYPARVDVFDHRGRIAAGESVRALIAEEGARPIDISTGPLVRVTLLRVSDERCVLVKTTHHITTDGWSEPVIFSEIDHLYGRFARGLPSDLPEPPLRYADYAVWQRRWLSGDTLREQVDYWRKLLAGAPALDLPTDRPRPPAESHRGAILRFTVPPGLTLALRELCARERVTLNMVLTAGFFALLHKYSGQSDIVLGALFGNRSRAELERIVGYFVNTAALRMDVSDDPTFVEMVARARTAVLDADAHQDLPFEKLVDELDLPRDLSRHPLFQVMYFHHVYVEMHRASDDGMLSALDPRPVHVEHSVALVDTGVSKFDLLLSTIESGDGLMATLEFATDLWDVASMQAFSARLLALLGDAAARPHARLSRLSMLDDAERESILRASRGIEREIPFIPLPRRFETQAAATPGAPALTYDGATLTYAELNARANRLARRLRALGAGPEVRVGVCLERTPELVVSLLAVLKSGAAYVPLDPAHPSARLRALLADARAPLLITTWGRWEAIGGDRVSPVLIDAHAEEIGREEDGDLEMEIDPRTLAYVLFTSGSTGTPKGVEVQHGGVSNLLGWMREMVTDDERAAVLASTSASFDVSVAEIFDTLCNGGRLVLVANALDLVGLPGADAVTMGVMVPTAAAELLRAGALPPRMATLNLGGEALPATLVDALHAAGSVRTVRNLYGPTEATVYSTVAVAEPGAERVSIGRPAANTRAWVLDAAMEPVPPGIPGELYVAGAQVARGYLHRPALTAERFLPDPFSREGGARMYRTGDRVRWCESARVRECESNSSRGETFSPPTPNRPTLAPADAGRADPVPPAGSSGGGTGEARARERAHGGEETHSASPREDPTFALSHSRTFAPSLALEYLGRLDSQVKVRGHRVELGEVEHALLHHPAVHEAVAVVRDGRLVAYTVAAPGVEMVAPAGLRAFLRERLPEIMVPAAIVAMDAFPTTTSGKIDRDALPAPRGEDESPAPASAGGEPSNAVEAALARVWADVLGRDRIGIHDDFFAMGGDSILSIHVILRAAQEGIRIVPRQIFAHPTIAGLAAVAGSAPVIHAEQGPVTGDAPLVPVQGWFFEQDLPDAHHWNHAVMVRAAERIDPAVLLRAVDAVMAHHDALRAVFRRGDEGWTQHFPAPGAPSPVDFADLAGVPDDGLAAAIAARAEEAHASLDLERGPVMRAVLFDCGPARPQRLVVTSHHLVVDVVSWPPLLEDLETAYRALAAGADPHLPPRTTSYAQWARRLAEFARTPELRAELGYWCDAIPLAHPPLPADGDGADVEGAAHAVVVELDEAETRALLEDVPRAHGTQINDALLAAVAHAVAEWTGRAEVLVEVESHGREDLFDDMHPARTTGWFTTMHPLLLRAEAAIGETLRATKEMRSAVPRRGLGYGLLRWGGDPADRALLAARARPEISVNYLGQMDNRAPDAASLFVPAAEPLGALRSPRAPRRYRIALESMTADGRLRLMFFHGPAIYRRATIERLANGCITALRELIGTASGDG
ncbi:non-ribosomal peptide synthetase [Longimicrobium sp.]|uniref:non-ribosomal peptide synthetase n=1 Tax=Longimicrobium sp. TaxID=2029185 RepID=UPI002CAA6FA3|nr:non-ribosomal peptide synthetase [Longimicrobium sp.]HSU17611.1 amino acid adenylation domain-containing protein [Longimicrobium sp.]